MRHRRSQADSQTHALCTLRKRTNGVSTNGVTADFMFFDRGTFWILLLTYFCLPRSARAYLFTQSVKHHYFHSGPISVDPISPQPTHALCTLLFVSRRRQTCHFRFPFSKRATSAPAEGPAYGIDFARHCESEFPLQTLQPQKWHVYGSGTFGAV